MPLEIKVTKEIGNYEPKVVGPFTGRQCLVFAIAAVGAVAIYKGALLFFPKSIAGYFCFIPAGIGVLFCSKPYGMKFEKFVQSIFVNMFLAPTHRRYRTENTVEQKIEKFAKAQSVEASANATAHKGKLSMFSFQKNKSSSVNADLKPTKSASAPKLKSSVNSKKKANDKASQKNYKLSSKAIR